MKSSARFRAIDMEVIDEIFDMHGGYVLDFSNRTFGDFFRDEIGIDIDDPIYDFEGTSKAKRFRYFLKSSEPKYVVKALILLWEYREFRRARSGADESVKDAEASLAKIVAKFGGELPTFGNVNKPDSVTTIDATTSSELRRQLLALIQLESQARGYAFEKFMKYLFDVNGLEGAASFKVRGEQIDGSFQLESETYLLEAKWTKAQVDASGLRSFNGKVEEKVGWSRGLLISESGFTEDGLYAFGRGKRIICMDGLDLNDMLERNIAFSEVMSRKVRRAAETGKLLVRVRDLF